MASLGSLEVSLSLNAANFNGTIAQVNRNIRSMSSELQALKAKGSEYENSLAGMRQKQEVLNRTFDAAAIKLQEQRQRYDDMKASGTATEAQLERQANAVNQAQAQYNRLERELADVTEQLRIQSSQWTQTGQAMQRIGGQLTTIGNGMKDVGRNMSMYVTAPIIAMGAASLKMAIDFESAFAGVRKTVDTTEEGFAKLEQGIRDMAKAGPSSATELASIMEMAGQLGIAEENLLSFTSTISDISTATNLTAEQAATEFARFANIVQMSQTDFEKFGSSIVALGNNFATTESEIMSMSLRLAGQGAQIGLSEAQIAALATTMSSLGIEAEAGGTAMSTVLKKMQNNVDGIGGRLDHFAAAARMSTTEFADAFKKDPMIALDAFIKGLAQSSAEGKNLNDMLAWMGIKGIRETDTLLRMAGASELLGQALDLSATAWEENSALATEAAERYATTESQLATIKNRISDIAITIGDVLIPIVLEISGKVAEWVEKFGEMDSSTQKAILGFVALAAAIGPVLIVSGMLISSIGTIVGVIGTASTAIGAAGGVVAFFSAKLAFLTPVLTALSGPLGWTVLAIAAIGTAAVVTAKEMSESSIQINDWSEGVSKATVEAVGGFVKISDDVGQTLTTLHLTSTRITDEIATDLTSKFDSMYSQIVEGANEKHTAHMESLQNFFLNSSALTSQEEAKILEKRQQAHESEIEILTAKNQLVAEIIQKATEENRQLTEHEREVIKNINLQMKEDAVRVLSESEVEQKVILEKMRADASEITALQAAEVVKNAVDQKQKVVEEANKQYEESIALITRMRDETGEITTEQAERMIAEAKKSRDQTIYYAEEMHEKIVGEAKAQAGEHVDQVEWETGEVKSKWQVLKDDVTKKMKETGASIKKDWSEAWTNTKAAVNGMLTTAQEKFDSIKTSVETKMAGVKKKIEEKWAEAHTFLTSIDLKQVGSDIIQGLINGIGDMKDAVMKKVKEISSSIEDGIKSFFGIQSPSRLMKGYGKNIGEGLVLGIESQQDQAAESMKKLAKSIEDVTKENIKKVESLEKEKTSKLEKIETDKAYKLKQIYTAAKSKKRQLTESENIKIEKLESDSAAKILETKEKYDAKIIEAQEKVASERFKVIKQFVEDKKSTEEMSLIEEAIIWEESMALFEEGTKSRIEAQKAYQKAVEDVSKELASINESYSTQLQKVYDDLEKQEEELTQAYETAVTKRADSLVSFKSLFDEFKVEIEVTGTQLLSNLQSQVDGFKQWQSAIEELAARAIDDGLIAELREMGPKALPELLALNQLTDQQLQQYSDLYKEKSKLAREQAVNELSGMETEVAEEIGKLRDAAGVKFDEIATSWAEQIKGITEVTAEGLSLKQVGEDAVQGLHDGMSSKEGALADKAKAIGDAISQAIKTVLDIHSPSRVTRAMGENVGEGLVVGMDATTPRLKKAAEDLGKAVMEGSKNAFNGLEDFFDEVWATVEESFKNSGQSIIESLDANWSEALQTTKTTFVDVAISITESFQKANAEVATLTASINNITSDQFADVKKQVSNRMTETLKAISDNWNSAKSTSETTISSIANTARDKFNELKTNVSNRMTESYKAISDNWNSSKTITESSTSSMANTVRDKFNDMKSSVTSTMGEIQREISNSWSTSISYLESIDLYSTGYDIMSGLLNGIQSMQGSIEATVQSIADNIKSSIQDSLDINSPSRVMMGYGRNIGEGLVIGMDEMSSKVASAAGRLASSVDSNISNVSSSSNSYDYSKNVTNNVTIHSKSSAAREMDRTLRRLEFKMS